MKLYPFQKELLELIEKSGATIDLPMTAVRRGGRLKIPAPEKHQLRGKKADFIIIDDPLKDRGE